MVSIFTVCIRLQLLPQYWIKSHSDATLTVLQSKYGMLHKRTVTPNGITVLSISTTTQLPIYGWLRWKFFFCHKFKIYKVCKWILLIGLQTYNFFTNPTICNWTNGYNSWCIMAGKSKQNIQKNNVLGVFVSKQWPNMLRFFQ